MRRAAPNDGPVPRLTVSQGLIEGRVRDLMHMMMTAGAPVGEFENEFILK